MKKVYFVKLLIIALCIFSASMLSAQDKTLLAVGSGSTASANILDSAIVDSLKSWGFGVEYMEDGAFSSAPAETFTNIYGCVFLESMSSGNVTNFATLEYPVPCLDMEMYSVRSDRWGWLTDNNTQFARHETDATDDDEVMVIKDNTHYITKIYDADEEVQFTDPPAATDNIHAVVQEASVTYDGKLAKLKSYSEDEWWFLFTIDEAPDNDQKMVVWGYNATGIIGSLADALYATEDFWIIMKRSAQWVFDEEEETIGVKQIFSDNYNLKVTPNPAKDISFVRFNAKQNSQVVISVINITGQEIDLIYKGEANNTKNIPFDVSKYNPGIYFVKLQINNEFRISKFVVE